MVSIIGVGTGIKTITIKAFSRITEAEVIIGASRVIDTHMEVYKLSDKTVYREYDAHKIKEIIGKHKVDDIAILVSGDVGFYSLADALSKEIEEAEIIPGISSVNSFFAKLKMPWQDAAFVSIHGRHSNYVDAVRRNKKTFLLTGNNIDEISDKLTEAGFGQLKVFVGSNLDMEDENILSCSVSELRNKSFKTLTVLLIMNENADASVRCGIPDEEFVRGNVPMTKSEVRANIISKLGIKPDDVCYDIGAGTGSVTVEMALAAWNGLVIAIEKNEEGIKLIKENQAKFHIGNIETICGEATLMLESNDMPAADVAFIGGSDGQLKEIISLLIKRNPDVRILVSAIALETLQLATDIFKEIGKKIDVTQIFISKNKEVSGINLMMANNPIYLIKGI